MKKMFLASSFVDVADLFVEFVGEKCAGKTVTFIPTASLVEEVRFYVETGKKALEDRGITVDELEISIASREEIESRLKKMTTSMSLAEIPFFTSGVKKNWCR